MIRRFLVALVPELADLEILRLRTRLLLSIEDGLKAEREVVRLKASLLHTQDWFLRASTRADRMQAERDDNRAQVDRHLRERRDETVEHLDMLGRVNYLERELADTQRAYRELQEAVQFEAAKKGRKK